MKEKKIYIFLSVFTFMFVFNSCVREDVISGKEPMRYTSSDIKSYADLFQLYWKTMDDRYNYFYEQKRRDGMDWNAVYREYYPKFAELKSFQNLDYSPNQREYESNKAKQYFKDIIDPILDRHFVVRVLFPQPRTPLLSDTLTFYGGMKTSNRKSQISYAYKEKTSYMREKLMDGYMDYESFDDKNKLQYSMLGGRLKSNQDIYYLTFPSFNFILGGKALLFGKGKYFNPSSDDRSILTSAEIDNNPLFKNIKNEDNKKYVKEVSLEVLKKYNDFVTSAGAKDFSYLMNKFKEDEILSDDLLKSIDKLNAYQIPDMQIRNFNGEKILPLYFLLRLGLVNENNTPYFLWFAQRIGEHINAFGITEFVVDSKKIKEIAPLYQQFLNPLRQGTIKKLIIDLRGNGGGAAVDINNFVSRFITNTTTFAYQRTKEGSGRFNYTQWVPQIIRPHRFAMPNKIPMVILTDKRSVSMSEISTLAWKSQGKQVLSVGDYTYGGTAGLTSNYDDYNGGLNTYGSKNQYVADRILFYMPAMATKDMNGDVIEGIGIKPDIYVDPPTAQEVEEMKNSPETHIDRTLREAIKVLNSK
ncbi:S41 family peptidase [Elizabethkingia occulta]|uniref:Tail specific protease domain-containing protein n=1 Tax=Elizabethkingia occulta TaxID=1867263 RepID=A0A1T3M987_9FLAO|nr:S41 family peptidase [Elizabethkingia occulta]OPC61228.1 hypothetical protein BAZ10_12265 [Elizabethkingia occulta]